jgi:branched-chain amino acid transport system substrate-binding protein
VSGHRALKTVLVVAALLLPLALTACSGDDDSNWDDQTIEIGSIFSVTGDGAAFGPQQVKGARLAINQINADGGVNGATLALKQRDDAGDPALSARAMRGLIEKDDVLAVLGPTFSNSSAEAHPVANDLKTPVLAVSNTGPGIVGDCAYPCEYIFRASLGEATAIPANVNEYVAAEAPTRVAIVYPEGDQFGSTSAITAKRAFQGEGVQATTVEQPTGGTITAVAGMDAVMIAASSGDTVVEWIDRLKGAGFKGGILGGNAFNSRSAAEALGPVGKGAQSAAAWYAGNDSEENREFIEAYQQAYGEEPDQFAAQAYTGVELLAEAADDADLSFDNLEADRNLMVASLEQVQEDTPLGEFAFTPDHDVIQPIWIVEMNGQGGYKLVEKVPAGG